MNSSEKIFLEHQLLINNTFKECNDDIFKIAQLMIKVLNEGGTIYGCGNGGSAADSQHLAAELIGRFSSERIPLRSIALSTDSSVITCIANDYNFEEIFKRQILALGRTGDLLVGISTSGNSMNVFNAIKAAKEIGVNTAALLGRDGGKIKNITDFSVVIPSLSTARIQETHILIGHCLCELIEDGLGFTEKI